VRAAFSAVTNSGRGVARRYARALLDLATERGQGPDVRTALQAASGLLAPGGELAAVLTNPAVPADRKQAIVQAVWPSTDAAHGLVTRLVALLVERGRAALLPAVHEDFVALWNVRNNVVAARVVSAVPLEQAQVAAVTQAVRSVTGREVDLSTAVDPAVLGGVVLTMEGRVYDGSVRTRLQNLRERLRGRQVRSLA
jgi:F-type H+-transporting ATPase subunit delta